MKMMLSIRKYRLYKKIISIFENISKSNIIINIIK